MLSNVQEYRPQHVLLDDCARGPSRNESVMALRRYIRDDGDWPQV
jgi:hypothetical protein